MTIRTDEDEKLDKDKMDNYKPAEGKEKWHCDIPKLCLIANKPDEDHVFKTSCAAIWLGIFFCLMEFPLLKGYTFRQGGALR